MSKPNLSPLESQEAHTFKKKKSEFHNMSHTVEYWAWDNMIARCERKTYIEYDSYGGRGIAVFPEWRQSFAAFYKYIGPRPSNKHSVDRINNDGNYEPGNIRWATNLQQIINRGVRRDNSSGYKGVSWEKRTNTWRAVIFYGGKQIHIGHFVSKDKAANMYDQFAIQLYGNDLRTNFEYQAPAPDHSN